MPIAKVLTGVKQTVPVKIWTQNVDVQSEFQLRSTASLPFVFKHVAAMPDVHYGIGATVGSVVATKGAIVPACVGVDIGCGMMAAKLPFSAKRLPDNLQTLFNTMSAAIPVGRAIHRTSLLDACRWEEMQGFDALPELIKHDYDDKILKQLGTLGGGNHFIEICLDADQTVWALLHSGSRGIGNMIGKYYIDKAKEIMDLYMIQLTDPNLSYLIHGTPLFDEYWRALQWAQAYAMKNREIMMKLVLRSLAEVIFGDRTTIITPLMTVNCHHNYAVNEWHFGENVIVTRKGAVRAQVGDMGIIPGSMGTRSYIVEGLGNADSFCSCAHGAGRVMSRSQAKSTFTLDDVQKQTEGIMCRKDAGIIDELPGAYKNIDEVMMNQRDLVRVVAELHQVLCMKG